MKKYFALLFLILATQQIFAQNNWDLIWTLNEKPFIPDPQSSEMGIVKAGFDTDQDGWGEFLCAWTDLERNFILMFEATADNTYEVVWYWEYPFRTNTFAGITVGDLDKNGRVEIITSLPVVVDGDSPDRIWFFEWNGNIGENVYGKGDLGAISPTRGWNFNLENGIDFRPYSLNVEDIDNDGDNELIVGVRMGDRGREVYVVSIAGGNLFGFGQFEIEFNFQDFFGGSLYNLTTGDLDNDGNKEIYALIWDYMTIRFFECVGDKQYELAVSLDSISTIDYGSLEGVRVADADNDGNNEMYISGATPDETPLNTLFIVKDISDLSQIQPEDFIPFYEIPKNADGKIRSLHTADPDNDGNLDLMIAGEKNGQIFNLEYKGSGDPADSSSWELSILFDIFSAAEVELGPDSAALLSPRLFYGHPAGDMDNDNKEEYVFVNYSADFNVWPNDNHVWILENQTIVGVNIENSLPSKMNLEQNYPNPFNPTTTIEFNVLEKGSANLTVYNMLGSEVQKLINQEYEPGNHKIQFNAEDLASGVYYYKLIFTPISNNQKYVQTKKLLLLK